MDENEASSSSSVSKISADRDKAKIDTIDIVEGTLQQSSCRWELSESERRKAVGQTQLYSPTVKSDQWPIVFHRNYDIKFAGLQKLHPFDAGKWGRIFGYLKDAKMITDQSRVEPLEATDSDLRVVHTQKYLNKLKYSCIVAGILEVPPVALLPNFLVDQYALRNFRFHTGGTILAAKLALERGWSINLGGGFHHCSRDRGGGFCVYADISLAIEFLFLQNLIQRAMIVDLDAHQGNGHERDYINDGRVYIFDMYNYSIYPGDFEAKAGINRSVRLRSGTGDWQFLEELRRGLNAALDEFSPDLILYNAGTDCLAGDPLGGLDISPKGIIERDERVFRKAKECQKPIVMVTSGGYQRSNARLIADSILNLSAKRLISLTKQL